MEAQTERIVVTLDALSTNKTAYKLDTECTICKTSSWTVFNPKKYCKFCYRAVCKSCSGQTLLHPERNSQERCCSNCHQRFLSQRIIDKFNVSMQEKQATLKEALESLNLQKNNRVESEKKLAECEKNTEILEKTLKDAISRGEIEENELEKEIKSLENEINLEKSELERLESDYLSVEKQLQSSESALNTEKAASLFYSDKLSKVKLELSQSQDEFARMRRMLEQRKVGSEVTVKSSDHAKITELQGVIQQLREQQAEISRQNEGLEKEGEREGRRENKASEDERLFAEYCELRLEQERLKKEEERMRTGETEFRQREAEKLQRELEKLQSENEDLLVLMRKQATMHKGHSSNH